MTTRQFQQRLAQFTFLLLCGSTSSCRAEPVAKPLPPLPDYRIAHVLVCLCDNENQGIAPVPAKIGNGRDLANNLYWGNAEGFAGIFSKTPDWRLQHKYVPAGQEVVLERRVYAHAKQKVLLVADAFRGESMRECLRDYLASLAGQLVVNVDLDDLKFSAGGAADFVGFIGHNGLMEFSLPTPPLSAATGKTTAIFCCKSQSYFTQHLASLKCAPLCLTRQNMYPGAFLMREVLAGWIARKTAKECTAAAATAYAKNQKISVKSAAGVFADELLPQP